MFAGIFTMFNPRGSITNNFSMIDSINKIGYSYNQDSSNPYLGVALLTNHQMGFKALDYATIVGAGFSPQEKWDALSTGISTPQLGPGNNGFVISAGPFNLAANDSVVVGFAVAKGNNLAELQANVVKAKLKYGPIGIEPVSNLIPERYELFQNYPNPFNPVTKIRFSLPKSDFVSIKVFDILGRELAVISHQKLEAGVYELPFDGSNLSSGVYFYRMETGAFTDVRKMVLVK
jgi:hypothetical protein